MKLHIDKAIYGGAGLARMDADTGESAGKAVFVPLTLPGEWVEANITQDNRSFLSAEAESILEPSRLRTTPACPYFGACGGCSYQHAVYAHQLEMKTAILQETLERARIPDLPAIHSISGSPWRYRNRIRLQIQPDPFALCYRERRSNRLLPVAECPIAAPILEQAIGIVTDIGPSLGIAALCDEIEFFTTLDEGPLVISFHAKGKSPIAPAKLKAVSEALKQHLPQLSGSGLFLTHGKQPPRLIASWKETGLTYPAVGFGYRVGIGSFFQVNRFLVDALAELTTAGCSGRLAWDLYAGVGLFARALTRSFERVIAVEASAASVADLRHNLEGSSHRVIEATTLDFLRKQKPANAKSVTPPDLVVVDPPRAGLGAPITTLLGAIAPAQIVYVSCDPSTLARDLAALLQFGYDLRTITMVDMFPQTFHLESVSVLTRR
jgi:23S rRNA (uracil1939-C5)-methyltransferase